MRLLPVRRISSGELLSCLQRNEPALLGGVAPAWGQRWSIDSLRERFGTQLMEAETRAANPEERLHIEMPLSSLLEAIASRETPYRLRSLDFLTRLPALSTELQQENPFRAQLPAFTERQYALWIAPPGNTSSLHHDGSAENLNLQVSGRKSFLLFAPQRYKKLSPYAATQSPINPFDDSAQGFPRFAQCDGYEATLSPGDMLFIPKYWWHCAHTEEVSVNVNLWFGCEGAPTPWRALAGVPLLPRLAMSLSALSRGDLLRSGVGVARRGYQFVTRENKP